MEKLQTAFIDLAKRYGADEHVMETCWQEIAAAYSEEQRFYHTLDHLEHLRNVLTPWSDQFNDWDTQLFVLFYHDIVYRPDRSDNEDQSAVIAISRMKSLGVSSEKIQACAKRIRETKAHLFSENPDTNYFLDADLSILGGDWNTYRNYAEQVRKEYRIYPDSLYFPGRKKVLEHFLEMPFIFKTLEFREILEEQARQNLEQELSWYVRSPE